MKVSKLFFSAALTFAITFSGTVRGDQKPDAKALEIESHIKSVLEISKYPQETGVSIAVVQEGKAPRFYSYGQRSRSENLPVTQNTVFKIASTSKAFTGLIIAKLVEEGLLRWDTPLKQVLPDLELPDSKITAEATVVDALSHRIGLGKNSNVWRENDYSRSEFFSHLKTLKLAEAGLGFRQGFSYNNFGYLIAGVLAERLTNQSWENLVQLNIFNPLKMKNSNFSTAAMARLQDHAKPYISPDLKAANNNSEELSLDKQEFRNLEAIGPAGSINSNVVDMAKWVQMLIKEGKAPCKKWLKGLVSLGTSTDCKRIVKPSTIAELYAPKIEAKDMGSDSFYGLGWRKTSFDGADVVWHTGNADGFSSLVSFMPKKKIGVVILTNMNDAGNLQYIINIKKIRDQFLPSLIYTTLLKDLSTGKKLPI